jgi:hemolysin III
MDRLWIWAGHQINFKQALFMIMHLPAPSVEARLQTKKEEIANCLSHGLGFLVAFLIAPPLLILAGSRATGADVAGLAVFLVTAALMYLTSSIYHALPGTRIKGIFRRLDHCAIYLLIAGTYTPFVVGLLGAFWKWAMLTLIWSLALGGIIWKLTLGPRYPKISLAFYLVMGWLALLMAGPLWRGLSGGELACLAAGGLAYTAGVYFYTRGHSLFYGHFIWHIFVLLGTVFHFIAVFSFII